MWKLAVLLVAAACCSQTCFGVETPAPRFTINLDFPASERFAEVSAHFKHMVPALLKQLDELVPKKYQVIVDDAAEDFMGRLNPEYDAEMRALSRSWNISVGYVVMANLMYDFTAACTSIVMQAKDGSIYHGRNLDYSFGDVLRNLTYIGDFQRGGKTVFTLTAYAGYSGALTGMRHNSFTVSVDERDQGAIWENLLLAVLDKKARPLGFLVRDTLDTPNIDFVGAVSKLSDTPLIAPVYLIVGGTLPGQGAVITRSQLKTVDTWYLDVTAGRWYVLETNYDHWTTPPSKDDRRDPGMAVLNAAGQSKAGYDLLQKVLNTHPVLNPSTTYTTLMSAADPSAYKAWVQRDEGTN